MKKVLFVMIAVIYLVACQKKTDQKLKEQIEILTTDELQRDGHNIESLNIENIKYNVEGLDLFYGKREIDMGKAAKEIKTINLEEVQSMKTTEEEKNKMVKLHQKLDSCLKVIDSLYKNADSTIKIYEVNYTLKAKTDKRTFDEKVTKYFYLKDLSELKQPDFTQNFK